MRKFRNALLALIMSFLVMASGFSQSLQVKAISETAPLSAEVTSFGSGSAADPWRLTTLSQLAQLSLINENANHPLADDYFVLMNDLDFSDANNDGIKDDPFVAPGSPSVTSNWKAIGAINPEYRFIGHFDGQGHSIRGLTISTTLDNQGLFGVLGSGAVIHDLDLINVVIQGEITVGGIAGRIIDNVVVHNVSTSGTISATSLTNSQVGGIIGLIENSATLRNVHSSAHVFANNGAVGGLVGFVSGSVSPTSVINAYFNGVINTFDTPNNRGVGGFFGVVNGNQVVTLQNALYYGEAYDSGLVGYFVGANSNLNLTLDRIYYVPSTTVSMSGSGFGSFPYNRGEIGLLADVYGVIGSLTGWINVQSDPTLYSAWDYAPSVNNGYPTFTSALSTSKGPSLYPGFGSSVIVDPLLVVKERTVGVSYTLTILNPQVGDSLNFVNDGTYGVSTSVGSLTIIGMFKDASEFQAALRSITFSTTGDPGVRVIRFTSATDLYYSQAIKSIIVPQATLTYDGNGNTSGTVSEAWSGLINKTVTIAGNSAALSKTGHSFIGWSDGIALYEEGDSITVTQDMTLSAQWHKNSYDVVFKDHDDSVLKTQSVLYEEAASAPDNPVRSGYHFIGWDKAFDSITDHLIVIATYEAIGTTITDNGTSLDPVVGDFADSVDFSALELDPKNTLSLKLAFALRDQASLTDLERALLNDFVAHLGKDKTIPSLLFDLDLFKIVNQGEIPVIQSNKMIRFTILVPEAFRNVNFTLLRLHQDDEGVSTVVSLPYTYDPITYKATFSTDQFSVFGFAYGETQLPDTGDKSDPLGFIAFGLSLLLGLISIKRRPKSI